MIVRAIERRSMPQKHGSRLLRVQPKVHPITNRAKSTPTPLKAFNITIWHIYPQERISDKIRRNLTRTETERK